jgi:hypothetical protein
MRPLVAFLVVLSTLAAGCGSSDREAERGTTETSATTTATQEEPPARTYEDLVERLPPFDVPASEEVEAYRRAAFEALFGRCGTTEGGAEKTTFEKANQKVLDGVPVFAGAAFLGEYSIDHRDFNGCPEGLGPPTSYTTYRTYRLRGGTPAKDVIAFYGSHLPGWTPSGYTACEQTFVRGEAYFGVSACNDAIRLTVRALPPVEIPPPPKLPPRPYGARYPVAEGYDEPSEPSSYAAEPGGTCERVSGGDVPSIIIPPSPGVRAERRREPLKLGAGTFEQHVHVEWWFDEIHGDCPPTRLHLTLVNPTPGEPPFSIPVDVRARSGTAQLPLLEHLGDAHVLRATAESLDGTRSRSVAVFVSPD